MLNKVLWVQQGTDHVEQSVVGATRYRPCGTKCCGCNKVQTMLNKVLWVQQGTDHVEQSVVGATRYRPC